jgi:molybdate transport system substrate-binding protein
MSPSLSTLLVFFFIFLQAPTPPEHVTVASASDLAPLEGELAAGFTQAHPRIRVQFVSGASGVLAQQIENGAPYDVFLSANAQFVDRLSASGKLDPGSVMNYAVGRVGLLWRDGKAHQVSDLDEISIRIVALPNPQLAPYGAAAQQGLIHERLWDRVRRKVVYGENVRQALQIFDSGNADAVLTAASLLEGRKADLMPAAWHTPIIQKAGVVAASENRAAARTFLQFLSGPSAHAIFARHGFSKSAEARSK